MGSQVRVVGDTAVVTQFGKEFVFNAMPVRLAQPSAPGAVVYWDPHRRPFATGMVRKEPFLAALALHPGAFQVGGVPSYAAFNDEWFSFTLFPAAAFTAPITGHTLLSAIAKLDADDWARGWVQPTTVNGDLVAKLRHTPGATSADVHCIGVGQDGLAALSSMTMCREQGRASLAERETLRRLCEGLGALGIVAFPCHAKLQLVVLANRVEDGRIDLLSSADLSGALVADPRLLPVFEAAMGVDPARGWAELHCLAFPPPLGKRAPPASRATRATSERGARSRADELRKLGVGSTKARPRVGGGRPGRLGSTARGTAR